MSISSYTFNMYTILSWRACDLGLVSCTTSAFFKELHVHNTVHESDVSLSLPPSTSVSQCPQSWRWRRPTQRSCKYPPLTYQLHQTQQPASWGQWNPVNQYTSNLKHSESAMFYSYGIIHIKSLPLSAHITLQKLSTSSIRWCNSACEFRRPKTISRWSDTGEGEEHRSLLFYQNTVHFQLTYSWHKVVGYSHGRVGIVWDFLQCFPADSPFSVA